MGCSSTKAQNPYLANQSTMNTRNQKFSQQDSISNQTHPNLKSNHNQDFDSLPYQTEEGFQHQHSVYSQQLPQVRSQTLTEIPIKTKNLGSTHQQSKFQVGKIDSSKQLLYGPGKNLKYSQYPPRKLDITRFELWHMILDYLRLRELVKCAGVSKYLFTQCSMDYLYQKFTNTNNDVSMLDEEAEAEEGEEDEMYSSFRTTNKTSPEIIAQKISQEQLQKNPTMPNQKTKLNSITETMNEHSDAEMNSIDKKQRAVAANKMKMDNYIKEEDEMSLENSTITNQNYQGQNLLDNKHGNRYNNNNESNISRGFTHKSMTSQTQTLSAFNQQGKMLLKESFHYEDKNDINGGMPVIRIFEELDQDSVSRQKSSGRFTESPVNANHDDHLKNQIQQIYGKDTQKANYVVKQIAKQDKHRVKDQEKLQQQFSIIHEETNSKSETLTSFEKSYMSKNSKHPTMLILEKASFDSLDADQSILEDQTQTTKSPSKKSPNQLEVPDSPDKIISKEAMPREGRSQRKIFNYKKVIEGINVDRQNTIQSEHNPAISIKVQGQQTITKSQTMGEQQITNRKSDKRIEFKPSSLELDPITGAYKPKEIIDLVEMKDIIDHRQQAIKLNYYKKREEQISLLRLELKNKKLREVDERNKINKSMSYSASYDQRNQSQLLNDSTYNKNNQSNQTANVSKRSQLESLHSQMKNVYYDPQQYKNLLMKFICEGYTTEVRRLIRDAPNEPNYLDCREFYFGMFVNSVDKSKESKMISPIAVAVNVGDYEMLDDLLNLRKKSPLQYACSLGLYQIVERLLQEGANPNNAPLEEQQPQIDYNINPLVICMNPKYYNQDLSIDGLTYKRKYTPLKDVDHEICMKLLIKYKADPNIILGHNKRRRPKPVFHAIKQQKMLKSFLDIVDDKAALVNQANYYQETPLCLVASEPGGQDNDFKAKTLIAAGASSFASQLNPLHLAIKNKNYKIMRLLYKNGDAAPGRNLANEMTPIQLAIRHEDTNLFKEMLTWRDNVIDFEYQDEQGRNLLHIIAQNKSIDIFKSLVSETSNKYLRNITQALNVSVDPNQPYLTPLYYCYPSIELARLFNRYGADASKLSFLHCFFTYNKPQLWERAIDISKSDTQKKGIALQSSSYQDYLAFLIKELKLDIDEQDVESKTAILHTYEEFRKDQMLFLIQLEADLEVPSLGLGKTMLLDAFHKGYVDLVQFLLKHGASTEAKDSRGKTISDYIKTDYQGKTQAIKNELSQLLYKHTLSKPFRNYQAPANRV
ncbi:ankyrin repeat protein [Stylonychia lemnae]|uniref:Ankyrin repeat protein n=1 Tax=Stylonychia lemnae TaxID=5949 RepID=A0A078AWY8_STYLE|nr:ankyrin repeat protein [Stylonychia lemnae]|eukprot:CDW86950.1 ankyrin repeat protein [Stylonychia lemnae]